jgi:UDP-2,3-diacylglucosamine hydrolase
MRAPCPARLGGYTPRVLPTPVRILSDCHIGAAPAESERTLIAFLRSLHGQPGSLLLNGDVLDFWFEWRRSVPTFALPTLGALRALRDTGMPITWIAGNHDCWGGRVLRETIGVDYRLDGWRGRVGAWDVQVEHGDGLRGAADRRYRALRTVVRHPLSMWLFSLLHPDFGTRLALGSSQASRVHGAADDGIGLRDIAVARLSAADGPSVVVFGHSHVSGLTRAPRGVYANPGAWGDRPRYLHIEASRVELREWRAEGSDECLDAVDHAGTSSHSAPQLTETVPRSSAPVEGRSAQRR